MIILKFFKQLIDLNLSEKVHTRPYSIINSDNQSQSLKRTTVETDLSTIRGTGLKPRAHVQIAILIFNLIELLKNTFISNEPSI